MISAQRPDPRVLEGAHSVIRIATAVLLGVHGASRIVTGGVVPFGEFLSSVGFPLGLAIAVAITGFELVGSIALILRRFVAPACAGFMVILASGIALVHARDGWFVVGGGRNGVEYSVLLLASLAATALPYLPGKVAFWRRGG